MITEATLTDDGRLQWVNMLDGPDCLSIVNTLGDLAPYWTPRNNHGFFTLGAATYIDICGPGGGVDRYRDLAKKANPILGEHFGDLYDKVKEALAEYVGAPCFYDPALALPGFHIFSGDSLKQRLRDNLHLDLQHSYLPFDTNIYTPTLTFTLPLSLPEQGAGIEFCFQNAGDHRGESRVIPYHAGELFIHSGRVLHRRAHYPTNGESKRITLQGHGVYVNYSWILYW